MEFGFYSSYTYDVTSTLSANMLQNGVAGKKQKGEN
jgi:hypothetical protein